MNNEDLIQKRQELIDEGNDEGAIDAYIGICGEEWVELDDFEEAYQGSYKNDEEFVMELLEGCGDIPKDLPAYIHIDWESTARDIMMDYSEDNGYYFRNL